MRLSELLARVSLSIDVRGSSDPVVHHITDDSRRVGRDVIYAATRMGRPFLESAMAAHPAAIILPDDCYSPEARESILLLTANVEQAMGQFASELCGNPSRALAIWAITGTNGKTSIAHLLYHFFRAAGCKAASIGTLGVRWSGPDGSENTESTGYTTPRPPELHALLGRLRDAGVTHVAMEASSEALDLGRMYGTHLTGAIFSNLSRDHLDHHGDMESYFQAKRRLFEQARDHAARMICWTNDPAGRRLIEEFKGERITAIESPTPLPDIQSVSLEFQRINASLAFAALNEDEQARCRDALEQGYVVPAVPGRMQFEPVDAERRAVVDYAHTPEALRQVLLALRKDGARFIVCVVGCGGDRDPGKRPEMGRVAAESCDRLIICDDNPRTEDPALIRAAILKGVPEELRDRTREIGDRRLAIRTAIEWLRGTERVPAVLLVAGKGHEDYQIIGRTKHHFSDLEEIRSVIRG